MLPDDPLNNTLPSEQARILRIWGEPLSDGLRIRVFIQLTPFLRPPQIITRLLDENGAEIALSTIIEPVQQKLSIVMHHGNNPLRQPVSVLAELVYPESGIVDRKRGEVLQSIPPGGAV